MSDLDAFLSMLARARIPHEMGPAVGIGGAVTRVGIIEQDRPWKLAAVFDGEGRLASIGTWIPPGMTSTGLSKESPTPRPIPGKEVSRQVMTEYTLIEQEPAGFNTMGLTFLETRCVGKCPHAYRI